MGYVNRTNSILNRPKRCSDFFRLILQQYNQCHFIFLLFAVSTSIYCDICSLSISSNKHFYHSKIINGYSEICNKDIHIMEVDFLCCESVKVEFLETLHNKT